MDLQQPTVEAIGGQPAVGAAGARPAMLRAPAWLAWFMWAVTVTFVVVTLVLAYRNDPVYFANNLVQSVLDAAVLFMYATVGALIASRHRENPIGWIFCTAALLVSFGVFAEDYAQYALITEPGSLPGGLVMAWLTAWPRNIGFFLIFTFLPLLFPNGRLPSRRWRVAAWLAAVTIVSGAVLNAFMPGPLSFLPSINNPLGNQSVADFFAVFDFVWTPVALITIFMCTVSVILRFRSANGQERQQIKWFAYAAGLAIAQFLASTVVSFLPIGVPQDVGDILLVLSAAAFPVAAGIAILRYRLYDIDLLINRTLVYVPLTGILAGVYSASIALFQKMFVAVTREQSDAAVVITTLILASSFTPIKNGLQGAVDKRFKDVADPGKRLKSFEEQVRSFVQMNSTDQLTQRLLDEVTSAFGARGAAVYRGDGQHEGARVAYATQGWSEGDEEISVAMRSNGRIMGRVALGARRNGLEYTERDRRTLQGIVDVVGQAMGVAEQ